MWTRNAVLCILMLASGLAVAPDSQAGVLWTFKNEGNVNQFTSGPVECSVGWDDAGKLLVTGSGAAQATFFGQTYDPVSSFADTYPPAAQHPLLTFRMQIAGGAETGQHLVVIYFDDTTGSYHGSDCYYRTGDQVIQIDLSAEGGFSGGTWDLATSVITKVGFYLTYDADVAQTAAFDWIALGDAAFTADVDPVYHNGFATEEDTQPWIDAQIAAGQMTPSWVDDGGQGTLHFDYADPQGQAFDPFIFLPMGNYAGADRPYAFFGLDALPNPETAVSMGDFLIAQDEGPMVFKQFTYYAGRQIVAVDPVWAAQAYWGEHDPNVWWGDPVWLDGHASWTMIQMPDGATTGARSAAMYSDFDWFAMGASCRFILDQQFTALDSDGDGVPDLAEILDYGTDPDEAPAAGNAITASLPAGWIEEGMDLTLTAPAGVSHQWYKDGAALADDAPRLTGSDAQNLVFAPVLQSDAGVYTCVYDDGAKAAVVSDSYLLDVLPADSLPAAGLVGLAIGANLLILAGVAARRRTR